MQVNLFHSGALPRRTIAALICILLIAGSFSIASAEARSVSFAFPAAILRDKPIYEWHVDMDDGWFNAPSADYNHKLAQLSMGMALAAFRDTTVDFGDQDRNLRAFFENAGFTGYVGFGYDKKPAQDTISNGIAYKMLNDDAGEYALVAAPVCGQGYGDEWLSNFTVGDLMVHEGFTSAAQNVYQRICDYIEENLPDKRIKIWLTGYSRAAAVSNMTAAMLIESPIFEADNVYAYLFACPNNTMIASVYPQIHNICGSFDPVPSVPLSDWGYGKYGVTQYLPALETTSNYRQLEARAAEKYAEIFGANLGFAASHERNWLISRILNMLLEFMPNAEEYAGTYQAGLKAAWSQKGSIEDKLKALTENTSLKGEQLRVLENMRDELMNLVAIGVSDTVNAISSGKSNLWTDILSNGKNLAQEHQPPVYLAWMLSTDDPDALFAQGTHYHRLIVTGSPAISITSIHPETGDRNIIYDPALFISEPAAIRLSNETFIDLPCDRAYEIRINSWSDDVVQIGFGTTDVRMVSLPLRITDGINMKLGEYVLMNIPCGNQVDGQVEILKNGDEPLPLSESADYGGTKELHMAGVDDTAQADVMNRIVELISMILTFAAALVVVIYALAVLIKRLVRGAKPDRTSCTICGRIMLYIIALAALLLCAYKIYTLSGLFRVPADSFSGILQTASKVYKLGVRSYALFEFMVFALTVLLCVKSTSHGYSRIRLIRLSILLFLLGLVNSFVIMQNNMLSIFSTAKLLVPLLTIIAVLLARGRNPQGYDITSAWMPAIRTFVITGILFLLYETMLMFGATYGKLTGIMKGLTGLPILISSAFTWKRQRDALHCATFFAVLGYMTANVAINYSMLLGLILFVLSHCVLTYGFIRTEKPTRAQYIIWPILSAALCVQLILMRSYVTDTVLYGGIVYTFVLCAMVIASFSFTKQLWIGTVLYLVSNQLLLLTFRYPDSYALGAVELLVFYAAVLIIGTDSDVIRRRELERERNNSAISDKAKAEE